MARQTFTYGSLKVTVRDAGEGYAEWDPRGEPRTEYDVSVSGAGGGYRTKAWGSVADFEKGEFDHRAMARMAVADLADAASDPDEFINMVVGEASGRAAFERGKVAERVIRAAGKFERAALLKAAEQAREEEEAA